MNFRDWMKDLERRCEQSMSGVAVEEPPTKTVVAEPEAEHQAKPSAVPPLKVARKRKRAAQPRTDDGGTDTPPNLSECICCQQKPDFILVRVSGCSCHSSIRYGICRKCRDTKESERLIEDEMQKQFLRGGKDTPEVAREMREEWWRQQQSEE
jgi:hypothetical protein